MKNSHKIFNKNLLIAILIALLLSPIIPVIAQETEGISFGIRPTKATEGQEETFSYFSYRVSPASIFNDEALVMNSGNKTVTLKIYSADAITAQNGGTGFVEFGQQARGMSSGAHTWVRLAESEVVLGPGEERIIPFEVNIPADASPGQHIAGLVVEGEPETTGVDTESGVEVKTVHRVGVAVVMDVDGEKTSGLKINNISLYQQNEEGTTFAVDLSNTGNIFLRPKGFFIVSDRNAERIITTTPLNFDTILPGDSAIFFVPRSARFEDGKYLLSIVLEYEGKKAILEGIGMNIKNGQPQIEGQILDNLFTPEEIEIFFEKEEKTSSFIWLVIAGLSFIIAIAVAWFVYWSGGKKEKERI